MAKLIYSMITSLDGYVSGPDGGFDWALDDELHDFITTQFADVGTYLYGRRMYETMVYWETAHLEPDHAVRLGFGLLGNAEGDLS